MIATACIIFCGCLVLGSATKPKPSDRPAVRGAIVGTRPDCTPLTERTWRHMSDDCCPGTRRYKGRVINVPRAHPIKECAPFPWLQSDLDDVIRVQLKEGHRDPDVMTCNACRIVYPETPRGDVMHWPPHKKDSPTISALYARVGYRVRRHLTAVEDEVAEKAWYDHGGK